MLIIGVDPGNRFTKATSEHNEIIFSSTVGSGRNIIFKMNDNKSKSLITINGNKYFVGSMATRESYDASLALDETRVEHENTVVLILTAVARVLKCNALWANVDLITGMPIIYYKEHRLRQRLIDKLRKQNYNIEFQGQKRVINFQSVTVFPEGAAALFSVIREEFKTNRIGIIDVGSWRSNYCVLDEMEYEDKSSGTLPLGMHQALLMLDTNKLLHEIEDMPQQNKELKEQIEKARKAKARQIADAIRGKWTSADFFALYLAGGGAGYLKEFFPNAHIISDPQMANARGLYKVGRMYADNTV